MEEAFVNFETALLLESKGFNWPVQRFYDKNGNICAKYCEYSDGKGWDSFIKCPTHQMAMQYLRKQHGLHIAVGLLCDEGNLKYVSTIYKIQDIKEGFKTFNSVKSFESEEAEEVTEIALKYTLENLI